MHRASRSAARKGPARTAGTAFTSAPASSAARSRRTLPCSAASSSVSSALGALAPQPIAGANCAAITRRPGVARSEFSSVRRGRRRARARTVGLAGVVWAWHACERYSAGSKQSCAAARRLTRQPLAAAACSAQDLLARTARSRGTSPTCSRDETASRARHRPAHAERRRRRVRRQGKTVRRPLVLLRTARVRLRGSRLGAGSNR